MRTRLIKYLCSTLIGLAWFPLYAHALTVSPVMFDNTMDAGSKTQGLIHLFNETQGTQTYYASVQNFVANGEEGQQTFLSEDQNYGLVKWINLDKPSISLKPGERADFNWSINLPTDAEPGGHYAAIFFSTTPPEGAKNGIGIGAKTGVLMLLNINGNIKESASLESFRTAHQDDDANTSGFYDRLPVLFDARIRNEGSVHLLPGGKINITNAFGHRVVAVDVNPHQNRVLPGSIRRVQSIWGDDLDKPQSFWQELKAEWKDFAFGHYTAELDAVYGKQMQQLNGSTSFWVIPWRLLMVGVFSLLLLAAALHSYNKMIVGRAMRGSK